GMAAVLRSNFWLALHVLIVTASYGAGALAWGLGNISLGCYALGRYRSPRMPSAKTLAAGHRPAGDYHAPESSFTRRPPEICTKLAHYIYRAIQIAVLLLAAGTITGAIWADYAWGRYWGWDRKEVWALISLLVYLIVLHGRWAGWTGSFGMAVGAVLGATAILMAWYGVNFWLTGGLHSYGQSAGGEWYVAVCVAANWLLVVLAAARYGIERRTVVEPPPHN
ncbi:MAG: cytochrome c biogenesis protein CcsA, partial [Pirellulales bacterium]|nr:cytochrome c biogenesis protein CcsA [Pirellulales bacterium]